MVMYVIIWFILFLASARRGNMWFVWFMIFVLTILSCLRATTVGTDTIVYRLIFDYLSGSPSWSSYPEPGWVALNKAVSFFGGDFKLLLWTIATITLIPIGIVISRESENKSFSLFIYYSLFIFFSIWNAARQTMAMSFVMMGYLALYNRKPWQFILWTLFGSLFHVSAIVSLLVIVLPKLRITKSALLSISFIAGVFMRGSLLALVAGKYSVYLTGDNALRTESRLMSMILSVMYNALLVWIFHSSTPRLRESLWIKIFAIGVVAYNLTMNFELGTRLTLYYTIVQIILFPYYVYNNTVKQKGLAFAIVLFYLSTMFFLLLGMNSRNVLPYSLS